MSLRSKSLQYLQRIVPLINYISIQIQKEQNARNRWRKIKLSIHKSNIVKRSDNTASFVDLFHSQFVSQDVPKDSPSAKPDTTRGEQDRPDSKVIQQDDISLNSLDSQLRSNNNNNTNGRGSQSSRTKKDRNHKNQRNSNSTSSQGNSRIRPKMNQQELDTVKDDIPVNDELQVQPDHDISNRVRQWKDSFDFSPSVNSHKSPNQQTLCFPSNNLQSPTTQFQPSSIGNTQRNYLGIGVPTSNMTLRNYNDIASNRSNGNIFNANHSVQYDVKGDDTASIQFDDFDFSINDSNVKLESSTKKRIRDIEDVQIKKKPKTEKNQN